MAMKRKAKMKKIPTLFKRDMTTRPAYVIDEVTPGCEWVLKGEGAPTVKYDGTCCMISEDGEFFKRREIKRGKQSPPDFVEEDFDEVTGKRVGWVPVGDGPEDVYHMEAFNSMTAVKDHWTYELMGPKIQGNPNGFTDHILVPHGMNSIGALTIETFEDVKKALENDVTGMEGIVWWHPDGRKVKIKKKDYQLERKVTQ